MTTRIPTALALFSGGLDSILAARLMREQGVRVRCLHFVSPFFGNADLAPRWERLYGLDIAVEDVGDAFVRLLRDRPAHGYGKVMNPCVDCKILMLRTARERMDQWGADCIVSGEVLGQRPMSQRRDALNLIRRAIGPDDRLLRPLSALRLPPTPMEDAGLVDRTRLLGLFGRGRKDQMDLAARFGLVEIPAPAGGCRLAERENACRYWPVLTRLDDPCAADFRLANVGRQVWAGAVPENGSGSRQPEDSPGHWLSVGRNQADNEALFSLAGPDDVLFKVEDVPGPVALGRRGMAWSPALRADAAAFVASFAPRAVERAMQDGEIGVRISAAANTERVRVFPARATPAAWSGANWDAVRDAIRSVNRSLNNHHAGTRHGDS